MGMTKEEAQANLNEYLRELAMKPFIKAPKPPRKPDFDYAKYPEPPKRMPPEPPKEDPWESMFELD